ncbi:MAG: hypothetical protein ABJF04_17445 [Reichenbachiella sp.]|uniref:hypothetical protein n=1 Tax=Reichenbachiella sp. TaxID=2184521 RepID=UPI003264A5B5
MNPKVIRTSTFLLLLILTSSGVSNLFGQTPDSTIYQVEIIDELEKTTAYADLYYENIEQLDSLVVFQLNEDQFIAEYKEHHYRDLTYWNTYEFLNRNFELGTTVLWDSVAKHNKHYDVNEKLLLDESYQYDFDHSIWAGISKIANEYSAEGQQESYIEYAWDTLSLDWFQLKGWHIQNHSELGAEYKDTTTVTSRIISGELTKTDSVFKRYDLSDRLVEQTKLIREADESSADFGKWIYVSRVVNIYNANSVVEEYFIGNDFEWLKQKRTESVYEGENLVEYREYKGTADEGSDEWFEIVYNSYDYSIANTIIERLFAYDPSVGELRGIKKSLEEFDDQGRIAHLTVYGLQEESYGPNNDSSWKNVEQMEYSYRSEVVDVDLTNYYYEVLEYEVYYENGEFREKKRTEYLMAESGKIDDQENAVVKLEVKEYKGVELVDQGEQGWLTIVDNTL